MRELIRLLMTTSVTNVTGRSALIKYPHTGFVGRTHR